MLDVISVIFYIGLAAMVSYRFGQSRERSQIVNWLWRQPKTRTNISMFCGVALGEHWEKR